MSEPEPKMTRRSAGRIQVARALWYVRPGEVELRNAPLPGLVPGMVQVRALFSGVSRGTERLVMNGLVPEHERERMKAPMQEGAFPFPVKYGYCAIGNVEAGPPEMLGRNVFCLHPHQDVFQVPADRVTVLPEGLPPRRATLAANMETALNAVWDSGASPADSITVVGAGIVGLLVAYIAAGLPGAQVTVIDPVEARREIVESLGGRFIYAASPPPPLRDSSPARGEEKPGADIVFHTSASEAGLATAIAAAGREATIVEVSWYGDKRIVVPLGGAFHSQRLKLVSSQVGELPAHRKPRWTHARRMQAVLRLLDDARLDALVAAGIGFDEAPTKLPGLLAPDAPGLAPVISYG